MTTDSQCPGCQRWFSAGAAAKGLIEQCMQEHERAAAAAAPPMPAGWRARRKHEAKLMHLADTYGPMCWPFYDRGMARDTEIRVGWQVVQDLAVFQKMQDAGVVHKFNGREVRSFTELAMAPYLPAPATPAPERPTVIDDDWAATRLDKCRR